MIIQSRRLLDGLMPDRNVRRDIEIIRMRNKSDVEAPTTSGEIACECVLRLPIAVGGKALRDFLE